MDVEEKNSTRRAGGVLFALCSLSLSPFALSLSFIRTVRSVGRSFVRLLVVRQFACSHLRSAPFWRLPKRPPAKDEAEAGAAARADADAGAARGTVLTIGSGGVASQPAPSRALAAEAQRVARREFSRIQESDGGAVDGSVTPPRLGSAQFASSSRRRLLEFERPEDATPTTTTARRPLLFAESALLCWLAGRLRVVAAAAAGSLLVRVSL